MVPDVVGAVGCCFGVVVLECEAAVVDDACGFVDGFLGEQFSE